MSVDRSTVALSVKKREIQKTTNILTHRRTNVTWNFSSKLLNALNMSDTIKLKQVVANSQQYIEAISSD